MATRVLAVAALLAACLIGPVACTEPTTTSPVTGEPVTAAQLQAQARVYELEQQAAEAAEKARAEAELRRLRRESEARVARLDLAHQAEFLDASQEIDARVADVLETRERDRLQRESAMAAMAVRFRAAEAHIQEQAEQRLGWLGFAAAAAEASGVPLLPAVVTALGGLVVGGGAVQATKRPLRKRAEEAEAARVETEAAAGRVVDSIDVLKTLSPEVAAAFRAFKEQVHEWQGHTGVRLVKRLQDADAA